jgi:hypothetical protein
MKTWVRLLVPCLLVVASCSNGSDEGGFGDQVSDVVTDTELMREANAAANQIIRNQTDCDVVKSSIEEVRQKLDEVESKLQTSAGRTAVQPLRKQVNTIAEACGVL